MTDDLHRRAEAVYERLGKLAENSPECAHYARNLQTPIKCALQIVDRDGWDDKIRAALEGAVYRAWDYLYGV